jgi:hypothetical protein
MACARLLTVTYGPEFSRSRPLGTVRSQRSSLLSRRGMNLLRMSSDLGGVCLPASGHGPRAPILTLARWLHVSVATLRVRLPRRVTRGRLGAAAACHPPDPFMEQLHVAMSVVGRQAAGPSATPALPQPSARCGCPGSGQGRAVGIGRRGDTRIARHDAIGSAGGGAAAAPRCMSPDAHAGVPDRSAAAVCRGGVPCSAGPRCAMEPSWCRMVRIFGAVRALDWV